MIAQTLQAAMPGLSAERAAQLVSGCNAALWLGQMTTVRRAAMFLAQVGEESVSLRYTEEIADGSAYEGRADLGNIYPGDGRRFKGRSFIQITGRANYSQFSLWAARNHLVSSSSYFVDHPEALADDQWAWMGPIWYFTVARSNLNALADAGDIQQATREINGGLNGLADRTARWTHCLALGNAILPDPPAPKDWFDMATAADLAKIVNAGLDGLYSRLNVSAARGGSLYVTFSDEKIPQAVYRVDGGYLTWIDAGTYNAMIKRYGGGVYVVPLTKASNIHKLPITPGTYDPRKG